jgi:GNAT superfamily N-acetyltransferase
MKGGLPAYPTHSYATGLAEGGLTMAPQRALRIEKTTEEDILLILTFICELAQYEKLEDAVSASEERLRANLFGPNPYAEAVIAYENDEPAAFALYFFNYSTFVGLPGLYLEDIFVRPEFRGFGIGRQLFTFLAQTALKRGCGRMEWAVLNWNEQAIRFYQKLGADPMREWTVFRLSQQKLEELAAKSV